MLFADIEHTSHILQGRVKVQIGDSKTVPPAEEPRNFSFGGPTSLNAKTKHRDTAQRFLLPLGYILDGWSTTVRPFSETEQELRYGVRIEMKMVLGSITGTTDSYRPK